jgi:hypothetical protein
MNYKYKYDKYKMKYIEKLKKVGGNNDYNELKNKIEKLLNCMDNFNKYLNSNFKNNVNLNEIKANNESYNNLLKLFNDNINESNNVNNETENIINKLNNKYLKNIDDDYILLFFIRIITELDNLGIFFYNYIDLNESIINDYDLLVDNIIKFIYKINFNINEIIDNKIYKFSIDPIFYYSNNKFETDTNIKRFFNNLNNKKNEIYKNDSIKLSKNVELQNIINLCYWQLNTYLSNKIIMNDLNNIKDLNSQKKKYYNTLNKIFYQLIDEYNELKNKNNVNKNNVNKNNVNKNNVNKNYFNESNNVNKNYFNESNNVIDIKDFKDLNYNDIKYKYILPFIYFIIYYYKNNNININNYINLYNLINYFKTNSYDNIVYIILYFIYKVTYLINHENENYINNFYYYIYINNKIYYISDDLNQMFSNENLKNIDKHNYIPDYKILNNDDIFKNLFNNIYKNINDNYNKYQKNISIDDLNIILSNYFL